MHLPSIPEQLRAYKRDSRLTLAEKRDRELHGYHKKAYAKEKAKVKKGNAR